MNICMCGHEAGYLHSWDCPYPLYRGSPQAEAAWQQARWDKVSAAERAACGPFDFKDGGDGAADNVSGRHD